MVQPKKLITLKDIFSQLKGEIAPKGVKNIETPDSYEPCIIRSPKTS